MPNGKTHDKISIITAPVVLGVSYYITDNIELTGIIFLTYLFSSFMFNGDLDTNSRPYNRWWLFKMIWIPYQLMFHHRSVFTHGIIIGTVVRLLYLCIIPLSIYYFQTGNIHINEIIDLEILLYVFIGLELGSAVHTISDYTF